MGVVAALDILGRGAAGETILTLMRPAHYIPATKRISDLLPEMQRRRIQLAVVVDEYGASQGIVTVGDIIEEIVGAIPDDRERTPSQLVRLPDGSYLVAGRMWIEEVNEALDWSLPTKKDYETVAGLILSSLGPHPAAGRAGDRRRLRARGGGCRRATHPQGEDPGARAGGRRRPGPPGRVAGAHARRPRRRKEDTRHDRQHGDISHERNHHGRLPRHAQERSGTRRPRDPGVVGARPPHQARLRSLRGRRLRGAGAGHVPRPDRQRARHGRQALHGAQHRPRREGPSRGRDVPRWPDRPRRRSGRSGSAWAASSRSSRRRSIRRSGRA